jgi:hypothetical protein
MMMNRKKDWFVAAALSLGVTATMGMVGAAQGAVYMKYDGVKGETTTQSQAAPSDVKAKPEKPQRALLLPAVQKAADMPQQSPPPKPRSGGVNIAAGDLNGDGRDDKVGAKPEKSKKRNQSALNQLRTNE